MRNKPYNFEIKELMTMFAAAFDDIVIKRYDNSGIVRQSLNVTHMFSPKSRLIMDLVNKERATNLPVVSYTYTSIKYNTGREMNKYQPFFAKGKNGGWLEYKHVVPIDITVSVNIFAKDTTDLTQIIQNFGVNVNPYCLLVWRIPHPDALIAPAVIHVPVIWDGQINTDLNDTKDENNKGILTAETTFTIQGWWFREVADESTPIYNIYTKYANVSDFPLLIDSEDVSSPDNEDSTEILNTGILAAALDIGGTVGSLVVENDGHRDILAFVGFLQRDLVNVYIFIPTLDTTHPFPVIPGYTDHKGVALDNIPTSPGKKLYAFPKSLNISGTEVIIPSGTVFSVYIVYPDGLVEVVNVSLPIPNN